MSWLSDSTELVSNGWLSSDYVGHGIRGADVPSQSILAADVTLPADNNVEFRALLITDVQHGTLDLLEDGRFFYQGDGNDDSFVYRTFADGVQRGSDSTVNIQGSGTLGIVDETDIPLAMSFSRTVELGVVSESSSAIQMQFSRLAELGVVSESSSVLPMSYSKVGAVGVVSETSLALPLQSDTTFDLPLVSTVSSTIGLSYSKSVTLGLVSESSETLPITASRRFDLGVVSESNAALPFRPNFVRMPVPPERTITVSSTGRTIVV